MPALDHWSVRDTIRNAWRVVAVVAVAMAAATALVIAAYISTVREVSERRDTLEDLAEVRTSVLSAETSLRGYALTRRASFLEPYLEAPANIDRQIGRLRAEAPPGRLGAIDRIEGTWEAWRAEFAERVRAHLAAGRERRAQALIDTGQGKVRIDRIRRLVARQLTRERTAIAASERRLSRTGIFGVITLALAVLVILTVVAVMSRRLGQRVLAPLERLAAAARRFGAGDTTVRLTDEGVEELMPVQTAFNAMAADVERVIASLREVDEMKSTFVSSVSHELRTPLTSIKGYLEALIDEESGPMNAEQHEFAQIVYRNANRLEALINDLLTLSRLESGRVQMRREHVDMARQAAQAAQDLTPVAAQKDLELTVDLAGGAQVEGDADRLQQVLVNLLGNAVKFTEPPGAVRLSVIASQDEVHVEVADTGVGIPAAEISRIGERFFRSSKVNAIGGTGLGLTISREIIERHNGRLEIESQEGVGSMFRLVLPRARHQAPDG